MALEPILQTLLQEADNLRGDPGGSGSGQLHVINLIRERLPELVAAFRARMSAGDVDLLGRLTPLVWNGLDIVSEFRLKLELSRELLPLAEATDNRLLQALARYALGSSLRRLDNLNAAWDELLLAGTLAAGLDEPALRAQILRAQANCRLVESVARPLLLEALRLVSESRDEHEQAQVLNQLGVLDFELGDYAAARENFARSSELMRNVGNLEGESRCVNNLAMLELRAGRTPMSRMLFEQALELKDQLGDRRGAAAALANLGSVAFELGELDEARRNYDRSRSLAAEIGDRGILSVALMNLGMLAREQQDYVLAATYLSVALEHQRAMGDLNAQAGTLRFMAIVSLMQGQTPDTAGYLDEALRISLDHSKLRELAICSGLVGVLLLRQGDYGRGRALVLASLGHDSQRGFKYEADVRSLLEQSLSELTQSVAANGKGNSAGGYLSLDCMSMAIPELASFALQTLRERFGYTSNLEVLE